MRPTLGYGLSVHHFVSQVGDYVGFAAIVAVAIMVLLLFAHARETAELRRRAEDAEDELALLHEQVQWLRGSQESSGTAQPPTAAQPTNATQPSAATMPPVAAPPSAVAQASGGSGPSAAPGTPATSAPTAVPPPAAARAASGERRSVAAGVTAATAAATAEAAGSTAAPSPTRPPDVAARPLVPGAPVGVGAPPLSSATKLIPPTDEELRAVAAAAAAREIGAGVAPGADAEGQPAEAGPVVAPPPSTVAAGRNGNPPGRGSVAAPPGAPGSPPGRGGGPGQPGAVTSPRRNYGGGPERSGGRRMGRVLIAAAALLVVAIVVVVVLVVGGNGSSRHHAQAATNHSQAATGKRGKHGKHGNGKFTNVNVDPTSVTVSVLNGTMTTNLAADVSSKLSAKGFQAGSTGNAADQSMQSTVVGYVPGAPNAKNDAYAVAHTLGLKETAVKPVSSANQTVACSGVTNCPDQVIVTVGADLNSDAT